VAKELGIAIILISQLNRSALHPSIKMLRGSGQIEESADNVVLIDRPEAYPDNKVTKYEGEFKNVSIKNTAKLILAKGRGVGTGSALVGFNGVKTQFYEIEQTEAGNYQEQTEALPF
jgi:replicative DNA helicase